LEPLLVERGNGQPARVASLSGSLRKRYGSDLAVPLRTDRPTVIANFVSTLDGVVSYDTPEAHGGGEISGFFEPDRLVMGLLRSVADAVLIGAGTLRAGTREKWTPDYIHPRSATDFASIRADLGLSAQPATVVVTASGELDARHGGISDPSIPVVVLTSNDGARRLRTLGLAAHVEVVALPGDRPAPRSMLDALNERGMSLVLCEGGPHVIGDLVSAGLVDELFLTVAPQLAGRTAAEPRLALIEGRAFTVADAPWGRLVDLRRSGSHLFTRYRFEGETNGDN
jgi:riboflavin biosynthesis pyrimidine reductase